MRNGNRIGWIGAVALALLVAAPAAFGQATEDEPGTENMKLIGQHHAGDGLEISYTDVEVEQEPGRPYAYLARVLGPTKGMDIVSIEDPANPELLYQWRIEDPELHIGLGGMDTKYFKHDGRYYVIQSLQFFGGPDTDLGAVVFDVTGLPDASTVKEVGRIRAPDTPTGFHNIWAYKHSSGIPLLVATTSGPHANLYDLSAFLNGAEDYGFIGQVPWPSTAMDSPFGSMVGYHDFYVAWDPEGERDILYGSGLDGYYIYDITDPANPELMTSIVGVMGVTLAHTLTATPDAKIGVGQTEYRYSPIRIYDLEQGIHGGQDRITSELSAWTRNYEALSHNNEMRYPYVFVSSYKDGIDIFDISDPENPEGVAYYDTYFGAEKAGLANDLGLTTGNPVGESDFNGAFGIDVRNYDGLIVVSDMVTGLSLMKMDGFDGWHGADHGMPNISSVQDWDHGPQGLVP
ncbi:MAG: hypothetical protein KJO44_04420 [Gemmatimonadetes bacterium]|nr:hypothetical protein [Gemmatimonadota bacterium]MBT8478522.1 hypothetical protein [Gemmatimonadota bacterium]